VRRVAALLLSAAVSVATGALVSTSPSGALAHPRLVKQSASAAKHFLSTYVTSDGRVLRLDQGGDIVSEGQAYGMLIAEIAGEPNRARTVWGWTERHLHLNDGLFAWLATGKGTVESRQSATDADVLLAFALLRYKGQGATSLHRAGKVVARAVLAYESVDLANGSPVLVAGPWAKSSSPPVVDPSYLMPEVFHDLSLMTGDSRWDAAAAVAVSLVKVLTHDGRALPPDWAALKDSSLTATAAPSGSVGIQYGLDAQRLSLWFASACQTSEHDIAANWWRYALSKPNASGALALSLGGRVLNHETNPLPLLASAAAASAASDEGAARTLRARASALATTTPTYYGDAWLALSQALQERRLTTC
jgi:endo-1,4-beta-D-glucanase Y